MNFVKVAALLVTFAIPLGTQAQESGMDAEVQIELENNDEAGNASTENPKISATKNRSKPKTGSPNAKSLNSLSPGWNAKKVTRALGFSTGFLNGSSTFIFETLRPDTSWSFFFGIIKTANNYTDSNSSSTTGIGPTTTTSTKTYAGAKNPYSISLGTSYNMNLIRNDWIMIRWGIFGGVDYFTKVDYKTGTVSQSSSSATPGTVSISETSYGTVKGQRSPVFKLGPVVDSFVFIRWLPQLAIGLQGGMLYATDSNTSTKTTVRTRNYQRINGVDQAPTSDTGTSTEARSLGGPTISTFSIAGTTFNLFGNFVLRYVW